VFAFSLPQNLHISSVSMAPSRRRALSGLLRALRAEVHRIDACFGEFVAYLKGAGNLRSQHHRPDHRPR
jgi:hypothetical protein